MGAIRILTFCNCLVSADLKLGFTQTIFRDGSRVPAYPTGDDDQLQMCRRLGYGEDVPRMCREHEILHTWLCEHFGLPYSPTLWAVAHNQQDGCAPDWAQRQEEALVLSFQAYLNDAESPGAALNSFADRGLDLRQAKRRARAVLRAA